MLGARSRHVTCAKLYVTCAKHSCHVGDTAVGDHVLFAFGGGSTTTLIGSRIFIPSPLPHHNVDNYFRLQPSINHSLVYSIINCKLDSRDSLCTLIFVPTEKMNKLKQKMRRTRDRLSQPFRGANASTSALIPAGIHDPNQTPRPVSAGGPLPLGNLNLPQLQPAHRPMVPNTIPSISSGRVGVVSLPQVFITPCEDLSGVVASASASHQIQEISPPQTLAVGAGELEPTVTPNDPIVPSVPNEPGTQAKVRFS